VTTFGERSAAGHRPAPCVVYSRDRHQIRRHSGIYILFVQQLDRGLKPMLFGDKPPLLMVSTKRVAAIPARRQSIPDPNALMSGKQDFLKTFGCHSAATQTPRAYSHNVLAENRDRPISRDARAKPRPSPDALGIAAEAKAECHRLCCRKGARDRQAQTVKIWSMTCQ